MANKARDGVRPTRQLLVRVTDEQMAALKKFAYENDVSIAVIIRTAIRLYVMSDPDTKEQPVVESDKPVGS